jgi:pimeloyl-ACP methyl ester carboxylesterase
MKNKAMITLILIVFWHTIAAAQTKSAAYFKKLTLEDIQNSPFSKQRIDGKAGALPVGTILTYETNEHRKGKLLIQKYGYDLTIHWVTYRADGQIYRSGRATEVRGTYSFDLDDAGSNPSEYDFWWEQVDGQQRFIVPQNGAKFSVFKETEVENDGNIYPYSLKKVQLSNAIELAYADEGAGDVTLLFIHGLGGYHQVWKKNMDELRQSYRCVAPDLPGCGRSSKGDYSFTTKFYSDVVAEFINTLHLKNVILVGHSFGGQVAITAALKNIPEVRSLVLLAPSGLVVLNSEDKTKYEKKVRPEKIRSNTDIGIKSMFNAAYASRRLPPDAEFTLKYRLNFKNRPDYFDYFCQMTYKLSMAVVNEPVLDQLSGIRIPTLILWGKEDITLRPYLADEASQHIPNCEVQIITPCAHMLQWECAEEVDVAIRRFVLRVQSVEPEHPVALFSSRQTSCIAPCALKFTNLSKNADRFAWMVNDKVVSRDKDLAYTFKKPAGYRVKLLAYQGNRFDEYEILVRAMGE